MEGLEINLLWHMLSVKDVTAFQMSKQLLAAPPPV